MGKKWKWFPWRDTDGRVELYQVKVNKGWLLPKDFCGHGEVVEVLDCAVARYTILRFADGSISYPIEAPDTSGTYANLVELQKLGLIDDADIVEIEAERALKQEIDEKRVRWEELNRQAYHLYQNEHGPLQDRLNAIEKQMTPETTVEEFGRLREERAIVGTELEKIEAIPREEYLPPDLLEELRSVAAFVREYDRG